MTEPKIGRSEIDAAARRIAPYVRVTPVMKLARGALGGDWTPVFKLEFTQHTGSFKARGAFNALVSGQVGPAGVTAISGGNHGAAVAYAARVLGHKALIFVPQSAPPHKIALIRSFGADVEVGGARFEEVLAAYEAYAAQSGALTVHPFGAAPTIAGQGTMAREWQEQAELDTVLIAVGGGGLISGAAIWWRDTGVKVVGVEPEGSCSLHAALAAGGPVSVTVQSVAADSLGAPNVGQLVYDLCHRSVDHVAIVSDAAITAAQVRLWQDFRIAVEPGGAAALAALTCGSYRPESGERVGILLCGSNVDLAQLAGLSG